MYDTDDFHDSIDDMCDDALRRMFAFREGGLAIMEPNDAYYSEIQNRDVLLDVIEFDTITRAEIVDDIHPNTFAEQVPDYFVDILAGAVVALARHASFLGRGSDIIVPSQELARNRVDERILLGKESLDKKKRLELVKYELGAIGATSLLLESGDGQWRLLYEAHDRVSLVRF